MAVVFSDTLFSVEKVSRDFRVTKFELPQSLTDEVTYISSGPFFDWLDDNQVCVIPEKEGNDLRLWYDGMKWIENNAENCRTHHDVRFYADKLCITHHIF